jgi:hypothetical protein
VAERELAVNPVGEQEQEHVEAEPLKVPDILQPQGIAPGADEALAVGNERVVVAHRRDGVDVDVRILASGAGGIRSTKERSGDEAVLVAGCAESLDCGQ